MEGVQGEGEGVVWFCRLSTDEGVAKGGEGFAELAFSRSKPFSKPPFPPYPNFVTFINTEDPQKREERMQIVA